MITSRPDGFGARMHGFLTAMYYAKKTGLKFGFVWYSNNDDRSGWLIEKAENLFEEDFIKEHCYKGIEFVMPDSPFKSLKELSANPCLEPWGSYVNLCPLWRELEDTDIEEFKQEFRKLFYSLPFKKPYQEAIEHAHDTAKKLGNFVAIHMRSGDAINVLYFRIGVFDSIISKYMFPVDLAIFSIKHFISKGFKIILVSADKAASFAIKDYLKDEVLNENFFIASDFTKNLNTMQAIIFDCVIMSKAKKILKIENSSFSGFANVLGNNELLNLNTYFDAKELYKAFIIPSIKDFINISNTQKAVSCARAYEIALKINAPFAERINLLNLALEFDTNNSAYRIMMLDEFFKAGYLTRAENYLKNVISQYYEGFILIFFHWYWHGRPFEKCFAPYINFANENYPYISFMAAKISELNADFKGAKKFIKLALKKEPQNELFLECAKNLGIKIDFKKYPHLLYHILNSAKARIYNHLAYKLGKAMIRNSKSLLGILKMPFVLIALAISHKEELQGLRGLKPAPLESYSDYQEALKEKECFTYKLGLAFIKANKTWFKGGYFAFFFKDLPKILRELKAKKAKKGI